jgi:hypothetical protein
MGFLKTATDVSCVSDPPEIVQHSSVQGQCKTIVNLVVYNNIASLVFNNAISSEIFLPNHSKQ